jgi:arylsulfatase
MLYRITKATKRLRFRNFAVLAMAVVLNAMSAGWVCGDPSTTSPKSTDTLPNIIIILTDDQGYADIGCFGAKGFTTPNLDRLARGGRKFTNFHVSQPVCSASRASLLTGCYANRIGIHGALGPITKVGISNNEMTLAELVKQRGYATAIFGKWHLGHHPEFLPRRHGFDEYFGLPYSNDMWPFRPDPQKPSTDIRRPDYPELVMLEGDRPVIRSITHKDQEQLTTWYTERAVRFIGKNRSRPFLLYLAHNMPHVPLHVSTKFKGKSEQGLYGDVIMEIDWSVGQVMKALEANGLTDNTLVIFTSDNGPWLCYGNHAGSAGPLREGKATCWEGGTRVPCIMRWPSRILAGTVCNDMLMTIDLFPTIATLIGADLPKHPIDGLDVWPILAGQEGARNPHAAYYFYYRENELHAVVSGDGRWKLQLPHTYATLNGRPGGRDGIPAHYDNRKLTRSELYDLQADVGETRNVSAAHPDVVEQLQALAGLARKDLGDSLTRRVGSGTRPPGRKVD